MIRRTIKNLGQIWNHADIYLPDLLNFNEFWSRASEMCKKRKSLCFCKACYRKGLSFCKASYRMKEMQMKGME